jgi:hypothetical protein
MRSVKDDDRSGKLIDYIKVIGGLIAAIAAVFEFARHVEQEKFAAVSGAVQLVQGSEARAFRADLTILIKQFYTDYDGNVDLDIYKNNEEKVATFIKEHIFAKGGGRRFKSVPAFLETIYNYGTTNSCSWRIVATAFHGDAGDILYYFVPSALNEFIENQKLPPPNFLYDLSYQNASQRTWEPCDVANPRPPLFRLQNYINETLWGG